MIYINGTGLIRRLADLYLWQTIHGTGAIQMKILAAALAMTLGSIGSSHAEEERRSTEAPP